ncbi:MAG: hypothetical protein VCA36_00885 [Opitutales bacterium]
MGMKLKYLAAIWGLAEATVFFIVPDLPLTFVALKDGKRATKLCLWALGGALVGGAIMFWWGSSNPDSAENFLAEIPAIGSELLEEVEKQVEEGGALASIAGPIAGRPYKIYAVYAGATGVNFFIFLLISVPARLLRFLVLAWLTTAISKGLLRKQSSRFRTLLLTAIWVGFYGWYFSVA